MTSKKINKAKRQIGDQTSKGGVIGLFIYVMTKNNVDPMLTAMLTPMMSGLLAYLSTKIGDPDLACMFIPKDDNQSK